MRAAAVVLAAGAGRRLAGEVPKPLVRYRGRALVVWALDAARASGLAPVVLVVGHEADQVAAAAPADVDVVRNEGWVHGIGHSLNAALDALEARPGIDAVVVGLGDQPHVGAEAYRRVAAALAGGAEIAVATYGGERRNPVGLARAVWPAARALDGDEGARALMADRAVVEVPCDGTGDPIDVDTPDDLRRLEEQR